MKKILCAILVSTCLSGCQPPAIVPFPGTKKLTKADEGYRKLLKNILYRAGSATEQCMRKIEQENQKPPSAVSKNAMSEAVAEHKQELEVIIRDMKTLQPPARYSEIHDIFLLRLQATNDEVVKLGKAYIAGDFEQSEDTKQEISASSFKLASELSKACRKLGYKSIDEFLSKEIMK
jgi:hypothetical protein